MGAARFRVSYELLREILNLPRETEIVAVAGVDWMQQAEIVVTNPTFAGDDDVPREAVPLVTPIFHKEYQSIAVFDGWNPNEKISN